MTGLSSSSPSFAIAKSSDPFHFVHHTRICLLHDCELYAIIFYWLSGSISYYISPSLMEIYALKMLLIRYAPLLAQFQPRGSLKSPQLVILELHFKKGQTLKPDEA